MTKQINQSHLGGNNASVLQTLFARQATTSTEGLAACVTSGRVHVDFLQSGSRSNLVHAGYDANNQS